MFSLSAFKEFIVAYKWLLSTCMLMAGGSGIAADFATAMGPPWPPSMVARGLITSVSGVVVCMLVFAKLWLKKGRSQMREKVFGRCLLGLAVIGLSYLIAFAFFTYRDTNGDLNAKGLFVTSRIDRILHGDRSMKVEGLDLRPLIPQGAAPEEVLPFVNYRADAIWIGWSIAVVNIILIILWVGVFSLLSAAVGVFIILNERFEQSQSVDHGESMGKK